jgi:hypothetical protein
MADCVPFGHDPKQSKELTALPYGMAKYSRDGFAGGLTASSIPAAKVLVRGVDLLRVQI